ncbi:adenylate/guanylate cyclase domain-containing protein [Magnetovibrio sp. PR-2]|uniref:adenylate/guanylate cyclase domain-containing protein n=1 Tax=Magnetovibrio sp. PR-2 TaxID=3120356 RepID=UPI002FCE6219
MAQSEEVTYEVLLFSNGRWEAQSVYESNEQHLAVSDAKSLAKVSTVQGVKVVKEFYDAKAGASRSLTVFEHKPGQGSVSRGPGAQQSLRSSRPSQEAPQEVQDEEKPKGNSIFLVIVKILLSLCFALMAAIGMTRLASMVLKGVHKFGPLSHADLLNVIFVVVFVIIALAMVTRILVNVKKLGGIIPLGSGAKPQQPKYVRNPRLTPEKKKRSKAEDKKLEELEKAAEDAREAEAEQKQSEDEKKKAEEDAKRAEEDAKKKAEQEAQDKAEADALTEIITMKAFTDDAFDVLDTSKEKQDAHTVFGLVLFLVGAVQAMSSQRNLSESVSKTVMHKALASAGLTKDRIEHFISSIDDYLIANPSYSQMFQAGRGAMGVYLEDETGPRLALSDAMEAWKKPGSASKAANQSVTVLFTDIAGSTAMTQKLGDAGAQDVVRIHNQIVRDAIKTFSGREIKHTGDGIMASFPSAVQGVEASMDMQKYTKKHNASERGKERPLGLKIGLNAGEPISEEDDLYGTTVQLAARIVDKAQAGEILVSSSVHGLSQGKNLKFDRGPDCDMKGFDEPISTYFAQWDGYVPRKEEPKAEPQAEPPKAADEKPAAVQKPEPAPAQPVATPTTAAPTSAPKPAAAAQPKAAAKPAVAPRPAPTQPKPAPTATPTATPTPAAKKPAPRPAQSATPQTPGTPPIKK